MQLAVGGVPCAPLESTKVLHESRRISWVLIIAHKVPNPTTSDCGVRAVLYLEPEGFNRTDDLVGAASSDPNSGGFQRIHACVVVVRRGVQAGEEAVKVQSALHKLSCSGKKRNIPHTHTQ